VHARVLFARQKEAAHHLLRFWQPLYVDHVVQRLLPRCLQIVQHSCACINL
jgi:hypothetical protein